MTLYGAAKNPGDATSDLTDLTDNTAGTADGTVDDVSTAVTGVDGTGSNAASKADVDARLVSIDENFAEVTAKISALNTKINDLIDALKR